MEFFKSGFASDDEKCGRRFDFEYFVNFRHRRNARTDELFGIEGWNDRFDEIFGEGDRQPENYGQRFGSRFNRNGNGK